MARRERLFDAPDAPARADLILAFLPLVFLGVYGVGALAFDTRSMVAAAASIACCVLVVDGLFWHSPRDE